MAKNTEETAVALTIAGSDSGGGAGIQADLKTFTALDVFGTTAITCLTAQNPDEVRAVSPVDPAMVSQQIRTVCDAFKVGGIKTGMLYSAEIISAVANTLPECTQAPLVVDPVMIATSGAKLLQDDAIQTMITALFPLACVVTPNLPEAELLTGNSIRNLAELRAAAETIAAMTRGACLLKGGHLESGPEVSDILFCAGELHEFRTVRIAAVDTHGTGCTYSAAIAAGLAKGQSLHTAAQQAQQFVAQALKNALHTGRHRPLRLSTALLQ